MCSSLPAPASVEVRTRREALRHYCPLTPAPSKGRSWSASSRAPSLSLQPTTMTKARKDSAPAIIFLVLYTVYFVILSTLYWTKKISWKSR